MALLNVIKCFLIGVAVLFGVASVQSQLTNDELRDFYEDEFDRFKVY